jgi:hypothetical protein
MRRGVGKEDQQDQVGEYIRYDTGVFGAMIP